MKESNGFKIYPESFNTKADGTGTKIEKNYKDGKYQYGISYKILGDDLTLYAIWQ